MNKSVRLDKVLEHLKHERDRFLKAGQSGEFCDGESCLKTAYVIGFAIDEINNVREKLDC